MYKRLIVVLCCSLLVLAEPVFKRTTLERLGRPPGTKLLIIQANDLGMNGSINRASLSALDQHLVSSANVIVAGLSLAEVSTYAKQHPDADLGIELTLTSDWQKKHWGPVSRPTPLSLTGPDGNFWPDLLHVAQNAKREEVEIEIRAQIDKAIKAGIHPTHLDCHMGTLLTTALFPIYAKVAREYGIPFFFARSVGASYPIVAAMKDTDIVLDRAVMAHAANNPGDDPTKWKGFYSDVVKSLEPGITEIIVHLGRDDAELRAMTGKLGLYGSAWRQRDFDVISNPEFQKLLSDNHVTLISWKDIKQRWDK